MSQQAQFRPGSKVACLAESFIQRYGTTPWLFRAPGRVNLIGEHTDYNDGFVMPAAIEYYTWTAAAPRTDSALSVYSEQFDERVEFSLDELAAPPSKHWSDYVRGVAAVLQAAGHELRGANLMISSEVPLGAGLSSSAALEVSAALAITSISEIELPPLELARLCQLAEHQYAGTRCGIMDQFISIFGQAAHALMLDCRSLNYSLLPLPKDMRVVICNTQVKHELAGGEYNRRRADCETGVARLRQHNPKITALRDVSPEFLERHKSEMPEVVYKRCRHVVGENQRVLSAAAALKSRDMTGFGKLMYASHASLRDDYEVSCEELDLLVEIASGMQGVYGARMTGGGFGGCTVNLVEIQAVSGFERKVSQLYQEKTGKIPPIYICSAAEGAGRVEVDVPGEMRTR
jgi:galactokinase